MAFGFRKRVKIAPGVHLNFGKRGISTSLGVRGASVNISGKGVRRTVGIPGTGLSHTAMLTGKSQRRSPEQAGHQDEPELPEVKATSLLAALGAGLVVWLVIVVFGRVAMSLLGMTNGMTLAVLYLTASIACFVFAWRAYNS